MKQPCADIGIKGDARSVRSFHLSEERKIRTVFTHIARLRCLLLLAAFTLAPAAHGQSGIKLGLAFSNLSVAQNEGRPFFGHEVEWLIWKQQSGLQAGLFTNINLSQSFSIQAEVFYVQRGMDGKTSFLYDEIAYDVFLDYVEVPLGLRAHISVFRSFRVGLLAGPYAAACVHAERVSRIDGVTEKVALHNARTLDYGMVLGFFSEFGILGRVWTFDVRYNHGMVNIMDPLDGSMRFPGSDGGVRTRSGSCMLGVYL